MKIHKQLRNGRIEHEPGDREERFWGELYWFLVVSMGAWIVALLMLPPRALETLYLMRRERDLATQVARLEHQRLVYAKAIEGVENDPYYREGVYRKRLQEMRADEQELDLPPSE